MADTLTGLDAGQPEARRATCSRCGAELRHPDSVADGIGPVCKAKRARETTAIIAAKLGPIDGMRVDPLEVTNPVPPSRLL
jgi:hypothetical protein